MNATLDLTQQLIRRRSVTPEDDGCQVLVAQRLASLGFLAETIASNGVTNLWLRRGTAAPVFVFAGHRWRAGGWVVWVGRGVLL